MLSQGHTLIRLAQHNERSGLVALWERAVRATHGFLTEEDIACYRPLTADILEGGTLELWVLVDDADVPIGFMGLAGDVIEALFLEPAYRRLGGGRRLVAHAQALRGGALAVDVNEQNVAACAFYEALGFRVTGRSALDPTGRPHALLHMRREPPSPDAEAPAPRLVSAVFGSESHAMATPRYTITQACPEDLPLLPAIELAAARLLAGHAPESVLAETTADAVFTAAHARGHVWVARANDRPVGFAHLEVLEPTIAHLAELDVHPEHARRGLGTTLVMAVCAWAKLVGYRAVTLTTFRDVSFNMPFYARLGFEVIPREELSPALQVVVADETRRGLDPARRVAMRRAFGAHTPSKAAARQRGPD